MELTNAGKEMVAKIFQGLILFLYFNSSLFSVGEDEMQRNNQEIMKRKGVMRVINYRGHSRCSSMDLKKRGAEWISGHGLLALSQLAS